MMSQIEMHLFVIAVDDVLIVRHRPGPRPLYTHSHTLFLKTYRDNSLRSRY